MVLTVRSMEFAIDRRWCGPVRAVSLSVEAGRTLALVGESGCGGSMSCLAIAGLLPWRARISAGIVDFEGPDLVSLPPIEVQAIGRRHVASVFQNATGGLNPVRGIGWQVAESLRQHVSATRAEADR